MSIDSYSPCPGGTGKKIKFCCNDLLPELQKINRMIEGEQFTSCLQHIERVMEKETNRDRACLLAMKCTVLRATGNSKDLENTAADFLAKHPDNQIAMAESAMLTAKVDPLAGYASLLRAMRAANGKIELQTYQAMGLLAAMLHHRGFPLPARALALLMCEISSEDRQTRQMLNVFSQTQTTPLLIRDDSPICPPPQDAPWKDRFINAMEPYNHGDWLTTAERFEALAADVPDSPAIWRNLATTRGFLADNPGAVEALRRFSTLRATEENGQEDAADAEALAMFLTDDPLGDRMDVLRLEWAVKDAERVQEALLSSPLWQSMPFDPAHFNSEDSPPPKGAYVLRDRPMPESTEGLSLEAIPRLIGQALLFGRQTDREARLELMGVWGEELPTVLNIIADTIGDAVEPEPKRETMEKISASRKMMRASWDPPRDTTAEQYKSLMDEYVRQSIQDNWPERELGVLDGRSPRQAADDPSCRARLLGAVAVLREWVEQTHGGLDFDELRTRLGLPILAPIDPRETSIATISAVRLDRIIVEHLTNEELLDVYAHAGEFSIRPALRNFAKAIIDRPSFADSEEREAAFVTLAQTEEDLDRAIEYVEQGRKLALASGKSCAVWDLMELSFNFARRSGDEALRLIQHIQSKHAEEPGVGEALMQMMVEVGLLRPDGSPAFDPNTMAPSMGEGEAAAEPESAGIWTPDADQSEGSGKLWTPGD